MSAAATTTTAATCRRCSPSRPMSAAAAARRASAARTARLCSRCGLLQAQHSCERTHMGSLGSVLAECAASNKCVASCEQHRVVVNACCSRPSAGLAGRRPRGAAHGRGSQHPRRLRQPLHERCAGARCQRVPWRVLGVSRAVVRGAPAPRTSLAANSVGAGSHVADAPPDAAALRVAGGHQLQDLLRALLARPEPARRNLTQAPHRPQSAADVHWRRGACKATRHLHWHCGAFTAIKEVLAKSCECYSRPRGAKRTTLGLTNDCKQPHI